MKKHHCHLNIFSKLFCLAIATGLLNSGCVRQEAPTPSEDINLTDIKEIFNTPIAAPGQIDLNAVEITVNGTEITRGQILQQANIVAATQGRGLSKEQLIQNRDRIIAQARDTMILQALLNSAVTEEKVAISDEEWDKQLAEIRKTIPEETTLEKELEKSEVTMEKFKESQLNRMKLEKLIKSKVPEVEPPTAEEAEAYYTSNPTQFKFPESVKFKILSITQPPTDSEEEKKKKLDRAELIRKELVEGANMDEKIAAHSEHPSKDNGGVVRIYKGSTGIQELETILFNLKMSNYSDVIVLPQGYVIYQAIETVPGGTTPFADVKERIIGAITQKKEKDAVNVYVKNLRDKADIVLMGQKPKGDATPKADDASSASPTDSDQ